MYNAITLLTAFLSIAAAAPQSVPRDGQSAGSLTWYTEGLGITPTACGTMHAITEVSTTMNPIYFSPGRGQLG